MSAKTMAAPETASAAPPIATEKKSAAAAIEMRNGARLGPGRWIPAGGFTTGSGGMPICRRPARR